MSTAVVTVVGPRARCDLVVPLDVPVQEMVADVTRANSGTGPGAFERWVVGRLGQLPLLPGETLGDAHVVDGSMLYLADAYSTPPMGYVLESVHPELAHEEEQPETELGVDLAPPPEVEHSRLRGGARPSFGLLGPPTLLVLLCAIWLGMRPPERIADAGPVLGVGVLLALIGIYWWIGFLGIVVRHFRGVSTVRLPLAAPPAMNPYAWSGEGWVAVDGANGRADPQRLGSDADRRRRVHELVEQLIYDMGCLLANRPAELAYADPAVGDFIRAIVAPFTARGEVLAPDFGGWVDVSVDWGSGPAAPVRARATFADSTKRFDAGGALLSASSSQVTLHLDIDPFLSSVRRVSFNGAQW